jgi:hypothetical protein
MRRCRPPKGPMNPRAPGGKGAIEHASWRHNPDAPACTVRRAPVRARWGGGSPPSTPPPSHSVTTRAARESWREDSNTTVARSRLPSRRPHGPPLRLTKAPRPHSGCRSVRLGAAARLSTLSRSPRRPIQATREPGPTVGSALCSRRVRYGSLFRGSLPLPRLGRSVRTGPWSAEVNPPQIARSASGRAAGLV